MYYYLWSSIPGGKGAKIVVSTLLVLTALLILIGVVFPIAEDHLLPDGTMG